MKSPTLLETLSFVALGLIVLAGIVLAFVWPWLAR